MNATERSPAEVGIDRFIGLEHVEPGSPHVRAWANVADRTTFTSPQPGQLRRLQVRFPLPKPSPSRNVHSEIAGKFFFTNRRSN